LNVSFVFLAIGASIFIGFVANFLFRRYGAPDVLVLILLGVIFGPGALGVVDESLVGSIGGITPYVAGIALAIIMFEAGMDLNARQVMIASKVAALHTLLAFLLSMFVTAAICILVMGWPADVSLMLGAILGGTSGAIVIPLVRKLRISEKTKIVLTLESALTDVLVIVVAMSILFFITENSGDFGPAVRLLLSAFLVSTVIGLISGILWLRVLSRLSGQPFSYMITLATLLSTYAVTEIIVGGGGGGAIASLAFGLVLGNKDSLVRRFWRGSSKFSFDERIKDFNIEISFFVRTFFFVYLGIVASTIAYTHLHLVLALLVFAGLVTARLLSTVIERKGMRLDKIGEIAHLIMMPRGLSAAVLASIPLISGAVTDEVGKTILGTTVLVILLTTVLASLGAYVLQLMTRETSSPDQ